MAPLLAAMRARVDIVGQLHTELSSPERLLVAASTYRPSRRLWAERFFKSNLAVDLRSRRTRAGLSGTEQDADVVFQTHALFETTDPRTVLYIDCTHRQSMQQWPDWNPLRGAALRRWLTREERQYRDAAHVFAFSQETARSLVEEYDVSPARVSVVGAGVNFESLPTPGGRRVDGPPTVLFVGNDFERKGGPRLLRAFAELRGRVPDARLLLVGTPHRFPAQPGVVQLGRVHGREAMSQLYREADVFCLPSLFDPFPGALLEAMAHALPSVATATCGVPEMAQDGRTAILVGRGPSMVGELSAALEHLLTDRDAAARMGALARQRVEERFQWSHVVERMLPVFDRLSTSAEAR